MSISVEPFGIVDKVRKVFPAELKGGDYVVALEEVSCDLQPGSLVSLLGPPPWQSQREQQVFNGENEHEQPSDKL